MAQLIDLNRLAKLRDEKPQSLMAYIRFAWPEIKAALDRGHTLKAVHQRLQECGINIGYRHLSSYVGRLRLKDRRAGMPAARAPERNTGVAELLARPPLFGRAERTIGWRTFRAAGAAAVSKRTDTI